jgi:acyl-CoA reductase-like NAD-dependent aldehyde dehydrogenase
VDVVPPAAGDVQVSLRAEGLRASIVKRVGNLEAELQRFVASYVTRELAKPQVEQARTIDVAAMIDKAWATLARPKPRGGVIDDLNAALESEILAHEDEFLDPGGR